MRGRCRSCSQQRQARRNWQANRLAESNQEDQQVSVMRNCCEQIVHCLPEYKKKGRPQPSLIDRVRAYTEAFYAFNAFHVSQVDFCDPSFD